MMPAYYMTQLVLKALLWWEATCLWHNWQYLPAVYYSVEEAALEMPSKPAQRKCSKCNMTQHADTILLGRNPKQSYTTWVDETRA